MSSSSVAEGGSVPPLLLPEAEPADDAVELYTAGTQASRALANHPDVRAVGPEDLPRLLEVTVPIVADGTPTARWVADLPAERYRVVEGLPLVAMDPTADLWEPRGDSVSRVEVGVSRGQRLLVLPPGFVVQDVRAAVLSGVPPDVLPMLVVDRARLLSDLDVSIAIAGAASLCIPAAVVGPAPRPYIGSRMLSAVTKVSVDDARSWSYAAAHLRAAAVAELVGSAVGPRGGPSTPPPHAVALVDGTAVEEPQLETLAVMLRAQVGATGEIVVVGRGGPEDRGSLAVPVRQAADLSALSMMLRGLAPSVVFHWVDGLEFADLHLLAVTRALLWSGGAPVRCGLSSARVPELEIEVGGPLDPALPETVAASSTSVIAAIERTGGRSLAAAFSWLARRSTYLHTATASRVVAAAELVQRLGSVLDNSPQWGTGGPEVSE